MRKFKGGFCRWLRLVVCLIPGLMRGQETFKTAPTAPSSTLHCLWKAQGKSNVVYLLGSIHLLKPSDYPLAPVIESAFTNSQVALFEVDIDKAEAAVTQPEMLSKITLPEGDTLQKELPPAMYASFAKHVGDSGLPVAAFEQMKPVIAITQLEMIELATLGVDPEYGLDKHFFKLAHDGGKRIVPLETAEFQFDLLTGFSKAEEQVMFEKSLEEIDDEKKEYNEMLAAWKAGDGPGLEKMLNKMRTDAPSIFKKLVSDRSASWVPQINQLLQGSQNAIVIVGAGHLVGNDGLVELLRKKGVKVTQL